jgi:hypothetical protein
LLGFAALFGARFGGRVGHTVWYAFTPQRPVAVMVKSLYRMPPNPGTRCSTPS